MNRLLCHSSSIPDVNDVEKTDVLPGIENQSDQQENEYCASEIYF